MPLQKQKIEIPLVGGIDESVNPHLAQPPALLAAENVRIEKTGQISKRYGYDDLPTATVGGGSLRPAALVAHDEQLLAIGDIGLHSYAEATDEWVYFGALRAADVSREYVAIGADQQNNAPANMTTVCCNGIVAYAWSGVSGGLEAIRLSVKDAATGTYYQAAVEVAGQASSGFTKPDLVVSGTHILLVYPSTSNSNTLLVRPIDTTAPETLPAAISLVTDVHASAGAFACASTQTDATDTAGTAYMAYVDTSYDIIMIELDETGLVSASAAATENANEALACAVADGGGGSDRVWAFWKDQGTNIVKSMCRDNDGSWTQVYAGTDVDASASASNNVVVAKAHSTSLCFFAYTNANSAGSEYIRGGYVDNAGSHTTAQIALGVFLASGLYNLGGTLATVLCLVARGTATQSSYYLMGLDGTIHGRIFTDEAPLATHTSILKGATELVRLSEVWRDTSSAHKIHAVVPLATSAPTGGAGIGGVIGYNLIWAIAECIVTLAGTASEQIPRIRKTARSGPNLLISGAQLLEWDGAQLGEHGFHWSPEYVSLAAGGAGSPSGDYSVRCTYMWRDTSGQLHESAPSPVQTITVTAKQITVTVDTLRAGTKAAAGEITIAAYRTIASGAVHYYDKSVTNDPTAHTTTITLTDTDATISANKVLYTDAGRLANHPIPSTSLICSRRGRVFAWADDQLWHSHERLEGDPVEWSSLLVQEIPHEYGRPTMLAELDGRVIVGTHRGLYYFDGDGPTPGGVGGFTPIRQIPSPVGAKDGTPTASNELGLWFASPRGLELLDRNLQVQWASEVVRDLLDGVTITDLAILRDERILLVMTASSYALALHLPTGQWSKWLTGAMAVATKVAIWGNTTPVPVVAVCSATSGNVSYKRDTSVRYDTVGGVATSVPILLDTAWIKPAGAQGEFRLYEVAILGNYKTAHTLTVSVYYDYSSTAAQSVTLSPTSDPAPEQLSFQPARQKCQAVRFRIADSGTSAGTREALTISHLQLTVGVRGGIVRLPTTKTG